MSTSVIRPSSSSTTDSAGVLAPSLTAPWLIPLFLVCLAVPLYFNVGAVKLTPTRIFLLVMLVPLTIQLLSGKAGKVRGIDICLLLFMLWMAVVMLYHHGLSGYPCRSP